jgi:transcription initiation factor TFIID subunit 2
MDQATGINAELVKEYTISHQKVELNLDLKRRSLTGRTWITVIPNTSELKVINLHCRQATINSIHINSIGSELEFHDPHTLENLRIFPGAGVHQHHQLRRRLSGALKCPPDEELRIKIPKLVKIQEADGYDMQSYLFSRVNGTVDGGSAALAPIVGLRMDEDGPRFKPITILIKFAVEYIRDGMNFVGQEDGDLRYLHAYTTNVGGPGSISGIFPCADNFSDRCTWDISINVPKTLGDAMSSRKQSTVVNTAHRSSHSGRDKFNGYSNGPISRSAQGDTSEIDEEMGDIGLSETDKALDMIVVCSGELMDEISDPSDDDRKICSFSLATPVAAHHVAFAVGPFEEVDLSVFRDSEDDERLGGRATRLHGFCLPGRLEQLKNTCLPMTRALDYFTLTYGPYPFPSYLICFVDDALQDTTEYASLSVCSNRLLFPEDILEPIDVVTRQLVHTLACQWVGVNIVAERLTDLWVVVGMAYYITDTFLKILNGNNDYRFRQKQAAEKVCDLDISRPSLDQMGLYGNLDSSELEFIALKAPLVFFILDRRLTKASGSNGVPRIVNRIFLNMKIGSIPNGAITTTLFIKTCEKLGHDKELDSFFQQWVFGSGCPKFQVAQRFNKKKLVVEMQITQVQGTTAAAPQPLRSDTFTRDVKEELAEVWASPVQPVFTGPMTIQIHEADGTPYQHIVELKEAVTRIDIPYNTKYKRLKRSRRQKERAAAAAGIDISGDGQDDVLLYCLGDVLQSEEEFQDWRLSEWSQNDENEMNQESFEWIRMDADFEWICKINIGMPGYMYLSQLNQERDVVAQFESIRFFSLQRESALLSTIFIRTLMDKRYFHGIRTIAAHALAKCGKDELDWIGLFHLERAWKEFFCFPGGDMTRSNDFSDRASYYIQRAIPQAVAQVKNNNGKATMRVKRFLYDQLKLNDNTNNEYSDCHYVSSLMDALTNALCPATPGNGMYFSVEDDDEEDGKFLADAVNEIERYRRMDEWISSYHNIYTVTAIDCTFRLVKSGLLKLDVVEIYKYTQEGTNDMVRLKAFSCLIGLGLLKNPIILSFVIFALAHDPSRFVRDSIHGMLGKGLGSIAIGEGVKKAKEERTSDTATDGLIIEQDKDVSTEARADEISRMHDINKALEALKTEFADNVSLKESLWSAVNSPDITLREMGNLLDICRMLYDKADRHIVALKYPRYWSVKHEGEVRLFSYAARRLSLTIR